MQTYKQRQKNAVWMHKCTSHMVGEKSGNCSLIKKNLSHIICVINIFILCIIPISEINSSSVLIVFNYFNIWIICFSKGSFKHAFFQAGADVLKSICRWCASERGREVVTEEKQFRLMCAYIHRVGIMELATLTMVLSSLSWFHDASLMCVRTQWCEAEPPLFGMFELWGGTTVA